MRIKMSEQMFYLVSVEHDHDNHNKSNGPIVWETYLRSALTIQQALERAGRTSRYGRVFILEARVLAEFVKRDHVKSIDVETVDE